MRRIYQEIILEHFQENRQMIFFMGPRQVGKTTTVKLFEEEDDHLKYYNWDNQNDREIILKGPNAIVEDMGLAIKEKIPIVVFDEIQKYDKWKNFLKGFFDTYGTKIKIIVTGSARLDIFQKGGDSLMGRYFPFYIHPFSLREIIDTSLPKKEISKPKKISDEDFDALWKYGGFPEPFIKKDIRFYNRWKSLRLKQLVKEDLRDLSQVQELDKIEILLELLKHNVSNLVSYNSLSKKIRASDNSVRRWLSILKNLFYCFSINPWSKNISRSLIKEPKYYLWDWAQLKDQGAKAENFVAAHLLKAVHFWTDYGFGSYDLFFIRDREKNEVDFVITKDQKPWILLEIKSSYQKSISPALKYYYKKIKPEYAFQVVIDMPYVNKDCFLEKEILIVPAKTFLSQLI